MVRKWRLFLKTPFHFFNPKTPSLTPLFSLSNHPQNPKFTRENHNFPEKKPGLVLTDQLLESTLLNCPSDLIALSFFLWCAKQPNFFHHRRAFDHMVDVVARLTQKSGTIRGVMDELGSIGCVVKAQTFLLLLRICWRGKLYGLVFDVYEEMIAFGLNDLVGVGDVLRMMLRKGYCPSVEIFSMVLNCFCKVGRFAEAFQVLGLMATLGIPISVTVWSILIDGYRRIGKIGRAGNLLEKMVETGCSPNVVTYTTLIKGFMESGMVSRALDVLRIMGTKGCDYDLVLYNVLIDCLSKVGRYDDALGIFFSLPKRKMVPDSYTFSSILSAICLSQRFSLLPKLFSSGLEVHTDLVVCNSLLSYFCKAGFPSLAVEFYNDMLDRGFMIDQYSFVGLLSGLCGSGRVDEAVNVYSGILVNHSDLDAHIHTIIIGGLIKAGKFHRAVRLFKKAMVERYTLDAVSYTVAIYGLLKGGRTGEACTLYSQMKEAGLAPNAHTYNIILSCFCKERDMEMVKQMIQEMIAAGVELECDTLIRITNFLFKLKFSHSVFNLLIEMWGAGLMPNKAIDALLLNGLSCGVKINDMNLTLLKAKLEDTLLLDTSGSDDLSDVAALAG
ncbi:putative pentatricopeptide repeat-containing protein At1g16830 isoform X2 [Vitis riparia]|uniref:putative pentatricopeptide repeat-containing protein At1g16830 isoform X2 n=1 Tax=Vitis riparia TaxID=96939 RepID=UPI00155A22B0|nr:putative pentatricopeptide repeat-containing protein At1g16830 isoform X2 [Vitis riparia]